MEKKKLGPILDIGKVPYHGRGRKQKQKHKSSYQIQTNNIYCELPFLSYPYLFHSHFQSFVVFHFHFLLVMDLQCEYGAQVASTCPYSLARMLRGYLGVTGGIF